MGADTGEKIIKEQEDGKGDKWANTKKRLLTIGKHFKSIAVPLIALASLGLSVYTAYGPLKDIEATMSKIQTNLIRSEITAETALMVSNISTMPYLAYKAQQQRETAFYADSPNIIKLNLNGKYELTSRGEGLIDPQCRDKIRRIINENEDISERDIIVRIGIRKLVERAVLKNVPPAVMMGALITYLEEG